MKIPQEYVMKTNKRKNPISENASEKSKKNIDKKSREMRERLTEKQIDKMIDDTFPASDSPSTY